MEFLARRACGRDSELMPPNRTFRPATVDDAGLLAELITMPGRACPSICGARWLNQVKLPGMSGRRRAAREEGSFSYRNATIIEQDGQCAGCLIGYEIPESPALQRTEFQL